MIELEEKEIKTIIKTVCHMFKKLEDWTMLTWGIKDVKKKYLSLTPRDKKYLSQKKNTLEEVKDIR